MVTEKSANVQETLRMDGLREPCAGQAPIAEIDPWKTTVLDLFRGVVSRTPYAIAVCDGHVSLSYAELWNFAAAFRDRLSAQGVVSGDMVGLAADRSIATVAAILGVVMAGACYVPVDLEDFPASVLGQLTERSGLRHWIADLPARQLAGSTLLLNHSVLSLEEVPIPGGNQPVSVPEVALQADAPLYVMFTSGSTGLPKGVVVPHRAVVRLVAGQNFMQFGSEQTFLLHSPLSFDASTLELWGSLLHGSRLIVAPAGRLGLDDYSRIITGQGVTTLWLTAAMFHLAAEHAPEMFAPLSQLLYGGDVIAPHHVEQIRSLYPVLQMVNGYGPTENTTFTCCYVIPSDYRAEGALPIGSPLSQTTVYVLDRDNREVPRGEEGELVTGGAGVALGYLAQPEGTAERFVPDTFSTKSGAKLYRTGDRVRQREDGVVEFLGRFDNQVKIAGHRVELDAIESAISSSPLVTEAAVVVLTPDGGEKYLVACVSLTNETDTAETKLRQWLGERLPPISVPQRWIFLESLPISANGKLDRNALRSRCESLLLPPVSISSEETTSASGSTEALRAFDVPAITNYLRQQWTWLLGRTSVGSEVGPEENFFDLGGTSLLLIEMHSRLRARFTAVPSLVDMFTFPTPRLLAERLFAGREAGSEIEAAEQRGQRQRAAMLARRGVSASKIAFPPTARRDGAR